MMTTFELVRAKTEAAHKAACALGVVSAAVKNKALLAMADALLAKTDFIIEANDRDMQAARENGMKESMQDRLRLTPERIEGMAEGLRQVAALPDPVGNVIGGQTLANGLKITKVRVPLGVIGIIYEARPNVTADAIGLCLKSGNAVVLKGGSEAMQSNMAVAGVLTEAAEAAGIPQGAIQFIDTADRAAVTALIKLNDFVDVVIPRGGAGLIKAVVQNATVPLLKPAAAYAILTWMQRQTAPWRVKLPLMPKCSVLPYATLWKRFWCIKMWQVSFCRRCWTNILKRA